ncbi:MAG: hypothetical protein ACM3O7_10500 [Acidobacteriota bacterium]
MRNRSLALIAFLALTAAPLAAQQATGSATDKSTSTAASQQSTVMASSSEPAESVYAVGKIISIDEKKIEVKVESVSGLSPSNAKAMTGKTEAFTIGTDTSQPASLAVGDRVEVWFKSVNHVRMATRIALAPEQSGATGTGAGQDMSAAANPRSDTQGAGQASSAAGPQETSAATGSVSRAQEAPESGSLPAGTSQAAARSTLPHTASDLPLVGLIGLLALGGAVALRFAAKA